MKTFKFCLLAALFLIQTNAIAKTFSNQFIEFQLPEKWECQLDGTEWVCQSVDEQKKRDAIIVLAAKIRKPGLDDLPVYKQHLEQKQEHTTPNGEKVISEPRYVKEIDIAGQKWVDALHLQSELPDFFTRYLATVVADLGVLVTFSVRKDKYDEYAPDIDSMVKSLRAFRKPGALNEDPNASAGAAEGAPTNNEDVGQLLFPEDKKKPKVGGGGGLNEEQTTMLLVAVLAIGVGAYFYIRKRKG